MALLRVESWVGAIAARIKRADVTQMISCVCVGLALHVPVLGWRVGIVNKAGEAFTVVLAGLVVGRARGGAGCAVGGATEFLWIRERMGICTRRRFIRSQA